MNDFEQLLASKFEDAIDSARASGHDDIAEYLALKAANDAVRQREVDDLFKAFISLALTAENVARNVLVEHESPHSFMYRDANMKGSLLRMSRGVRSLIVEAGWTRAPGDGFMRLSAMAVARVSHFGIPGKNALLLLRSHGDGYSWYEQKENAVSNSRFLPEDIDRHVRIFLNDRIR